MSDKNIWDILGIHVTIDRKAIQKAYANKTKLLHPEEHPEEFMELHEAYKKAIHFAKRQKNIHVEHTLSKQQKEEKKQAQTFDFSPSSEQYSPKKETNTASYSFSHGIKEAKAQEDTEPHKKTTDVSKEEAQTQQDYNFDTVFETNDTLQHLVSKQEKPYDYTQRQQSKTDKTTNETKLKQYDHHEQTNNKATKKHEETDATQVARQAQASMAYGFLFQEARKKQEEKRSEKRKVLLTQIAQQIADTSFREKDWKQFIEDDEFQEIAEDPTFLKELFHLLASYVVLPLPCFLTLSTYYQYVDAPATTKEVNTLLSLLDAQYPMYEKQKIQKQKKNYILFFIGTILSLLMVSFLTKNIAFAAVSCPICCTLFVYSYLQAGNAGKPLYKKQWIIVSLILLLSSLVPIFTYQATYHDPQEDVIQYIQDTYVQDIAFVKKIKSSTALSDTSVYQFQDTTNELIFEVEMKQTKDGIVKLEDNYASSYVKKLLAKEDVFSSHVEPTTTQLNRQLEIIESYDILLQQSSDISSIANTLYNLHQEVSVMDIYAQCKDYGFYVTGRKTSYSSMLPPHFTLQQLANLQEQDIYDLLMQAYVNYQLDYTLQEMDVSNPYVQQYLASASGIDIQVEKETYHFDDVLVVDGKITLGNFYRLAKHLNWNITITGEDSFTWEYHGRVQVFGAGSIQPYIEQSNLEALLWGQERIHSSL